jgi:hypothetical protein
MVTRVDAVPAAPVQWSGSNRSNTRDRQWTYKHAAEALCKPGVSVEDLISIRDRVPNDSRRGQSMRRKLDARIREIRNVPTIGDL